MIPILNIVVFLITLVAELLVGFALLFSAIRPGSRIWPPPEKKSWQFYFMWILISTIYIGVILVGFVDWDTFIYFHFSRFILGGVFVGVGLFFFIWGLVTLSMHSSLGLEGELITNGPYRVSRNPQYVAIFFIIVGLIFITNSILALISGILGIIGHVIAPFAEEPWLRDQFGEKYEEYCKKVRRFL